MQNDIIQMHVDVVKVLWIKGIIQCSSRERDLGELCGEGLAWLSVMSEGWAGGWDQFRSFVCV